jgi:LuxR family maltose regulon positive regulatory protein
LLRQQLQRRSLTQTGDSELDVTKLHIRASVWYEANGLEIEAFQHAVAANDIGRAERLIEGDGMPLHFRGTVAPILSWLASLPTTVLDARPSLWVTYASVLTFVGQPTSEVEAKLQAAEAALRQAEPNDKTRDLSGHIATIRAMLAIPLGQVETIIDQSRLALELLQPDNLPVRTFTTWTLGLAYQLQGDRAAAEEAFTAAIAISQASGNTMVTIAAATCLGQVRETENQLYVAAESYQQVLDLIGDPPWPTACEAYLGLARVHYQWNDLTAAEQYGQLSLQLAKQVKNVPTPASCGVFLVQLKLAQGDVTGAAAILAETEQFVHQRNFVHLLPEIATARMLVLLHQGDPVAAAHLAEQYDLPLSRARVHLAQGDPATALTALVPFDQHAEAKGWVDEQLRVIVLQALAYQAQGEKMPAIRRLDEALALAEPGGFIRLFVDEGQPLATLLTAASAHGIRPGYVGRLLTAFESALYNEGQTPKPAFSPPVLDTPLLVEPLSQRELEVLQLIAQGLSNREISERLFLALDTVKGHNRRIFSKLQVQRRTEAVAKARALNLLPDSD